VGGESPVTKPNNSKKINGKKTKFKIKPFSSPVPHFSPVSCSWTWHVLSLLSSSHLPSQSLRTSPCFPRIVW